MRKVVAIFFAVLLFVTAATAWAQPSLCLDERDVSCGSECRLVMGLIACFYQERDPRNGCTDWTYNRCISGSFESCGFPGGF